MKYIKKSNKLRVMLRIIAPIAVLVIILQALFLFPPVETNATGISWASASPTVYSSKPASSSPEFCPTQLQSTTIAGQSGTRDVCVAGKNENVRFGIYYEGGFFKVVSFGYDTQMYRAYVPCDGAYDCLYLPQTDTLVTKQNLVYARSSSLVVYKNFSKRLARTINGATFATEYTFDSSNPDYILRNSTGTQWGVGGIGASENGKWLAVEVKERAMGLLNLETLEFKIISNQWFWYGVGRDVTAELAVSDDGGAVAVGGMNAYLSIYDTSGGCGDYTLTDRNQPMLPIANTCPSVFFDSTLFIEHFKDGYKPSFSSDGAELSFYATSYNGDANDVVLRAAGYTPPTMDYLALGDSYSSGEGDTDPNPATSRKYYRNYTDNEEDKSRNIPREKCHISTRSYPYLLAHGMGLALDNPKQWDTVACSGATTWDVKEQGSDDYNGQGDRLKNFNHTALKVQSLNEFIPGRQKQVEFVKKHKPKVITLTMGGNDVGFGDRLKDCVFGPNTCELAIEPDRSKFADEIRNQYSSLKSLYERLYEASDSKAKIYVLGYPQFINGDRDASCPPNIGMLNADEREMIKNSAVYLNSVIKKAAEAAGVKYIDIENSLEGHKLCDNGKAYTTGLAAWGSSENQESFHPNANGNAAIANSVWSEDNVDGVSLLDYDICPVSDLNTCPNPSATKDSINTPSYFEISDTPINSLYKEMTSEGGVKGAFVHVITGLYSLTAGSMAQLTLHSEPVDLGSYVVDETGQLDISALIPTSVPAGYHTLVVAGTTYSGELIQLEQTLLVQGSNPSDIDDNNIPDSKQACLFIASSGVDADSDGIDDACDPEIGSRTTVSVDTGGTPVLSSNKSDKLAGGNSDNKKASVYDNKSDAYTLLGMMPNRNKPASPPQLSVDDSVDASRKFTPLNLFATFVFTTLFILTTIGVLVIKKRKIPKDKK